MVIWNQGRRGLEGEKFDQYTFTLYFSFDPLYLTSLLIDYPLVSASHHVHAHNNTNTRRRTGIVVHVSIGILGWYLYHTLSIAVCQKY
ncbi:Bgt-20433 [Blumeria graminis f. sp. tritici]|uniref:Bgt-20433 n=2 Tax=Blumeria graminis f. sp. tritici TaxID=62690 RepID=A0A9X9L993_BLUGR|nr:Bgt-20433 [Blumeria graminis f. sp. tritici]